MARVPWWGVVAAFTSPVVLISGWAVAAVLQPHTYNAVSDTVSALAAPGSADRWVMTLAFVGAGVGEVVTGLALRPAGTLGRFILIAAGFSGMLVAANPDPPGGSLAHTFWAAVGFAALTIWPAGAARPGPAVPWALRPAATGLAIGVMLALLGWFTVELAGGIGQTGVAERALSVAQTIWPLLVVLACRRNHAHPEPKPGLVGADVQG